MDVDELFDEVIGREGGYVKHPVDRGGPTRWGSTGAAARAQGWCGEMRRFPRDEAVAIYRRLYWLRPGFDQVAEQAPALAAELFDTGVNMGPPVAAGFLQRALNALNRGARDYADIAVDRRLGPRTLAALRGFLDRRGSAGDGAAEGRRGAPRRALPGARRTAPGQRRDRKSTRLNSSH